MATFNWSALTKEQKQYVFLGVIVGAALLYVGFTFLSGSLPASGAASASLSLDQLEEQVGRAEATIRREARIIEEYESTLAFLDEQARRYFPKEDNRYAWVTELIYSQARALDIEVQSIDELARPSAAKDEPFSRYAVQVNMSCSYADTLAFLSRFEESNPLLRITRLSVEANNRDPINHRVTAVLEWPTSLNLKRLEQPAGDD